MGWQCGCEVPNKRRQTLRTAHTVLDMLRCRCIPVIIQDGVDMALSSLLDVEKYSIRVMQADITRIPEILQAVSKEEIARMQALIAKVAKRSVDLLTGTAASAVF